VLADLEHGMHCVRLRCTWRNAFVVRRGVVAHTPRVCGNLHMVHCVRRIVAYCTLYVARAVSSSRTSHSFAAPRTCTPTAGSDYNATSCNGKGTRTQRIIHLATHHAARKIHSSFQQTAAATLFGALATHALLTHALVLPSIHRARVPPITRYCDSSKGINLLSQQG
jgi:hypothetical protein